MLLGYETSSTLALLFLRNDRRNPPFLTLSRLLCHNYPLIHNSVRYACVQKPHILPTGNPSRGLFDLLPALGLVSRGEDRSGEDDSWGEE